MHRNSRALLLAGSSWLAAFGSLAAQADSEAPIADALRESSDDVRLYNDHVVTLSNPFMEGRLPGTRGMEIAKEYMEHYFRQAGLMPPFVEGGSAEGGTTYRQPFELGGTLQVTERHLSVSGNASSFTSERDYVVMGTGGSGSVSGPVVFVGYSIDNGPDGYSSYGPNDDLTGKIALMFRFEPMDANGKSLWSERGPWSGRSGFAGKIRAASNRGAAGILIVNTPGADDPRVGQLLAPGGGGSRVTDVPVMMMTAEAAEKLVRRAGPNGPSLMDMRRSADQGGGIVPLNVELDLRAKLERVPLIAENVAGLLPGKGRLANEYIVIGAHLDHLGMGEFGSRSGPGELHPGADDNASGSAALLMLGDRLAADYEAMPEGADARSVLIMGFSAEESGLNGSRYYANNPIVPIDQHVLMINFDMIGRIADKRLSISGAMTGEGMAEFLDPYFEESSLEIVQPEAMSGASDHTSFYQKDVPVLFGIIADFHGDYHTPRDESWKINRVDAVETIDLFHKITLAAATRPDRFEFTGQRRAGRRPNSRPQLKVRFGARASRDSDGAPGVLVNSVTEGSAAEAAGLQAGDRIMRWDNEELDDLDQLIRNLAKCNPGDEIELLVRRDGEEMGMKVKL